MSEMRRDADVPARSWLANIPEGDRRAAIFLIRMLNELAGDRDAQALLEVSERVRTECPVEWWQDDEEENEDA